MMVRLFQLKWGQGAQGRLLTVFGCWYIDLRLGPGYEYEYKFGEDSES